MSIKMRFLYFVRDKINFKIATTLFMVYIHNLISMRQCKPLVPSLEDVSQKGSELKLFLDLIPQEIHDCSLIVIKVSSHHFHQDFTHVAELGMSFYKEIFSWDYQNISYKNSSNNTYFKRHIPIFGKSCKLVVVKFSNSCLPSELDLTEISNLLNRFSTISEDFYVFQTETVVSFKRIVNHDLLKYVKNKFGIIYAPTKSMNKSYSAKQLIVMKPLTSTTTVINFQKNITKLQMEILFPSRQKLYFYKSNLIVGCPIITANVLLCKSELTGGTFKEALDFLKQKFNFTVKLVPNPDFGYKVNGTWVGVVSDLNENKVDIGLSIGANYERFQLLRYSSCVAFTWLTFTSGVSRPSYTWKSVYKPLSTLVWFLIFCCVFASIIVLFLGGSKEQSKFLGNFIFVIMLEQAVKQTNIVKNGRLSFKILLAVWLFCNMILVVSYRSKLFTLVTFPVMEKPLETFEDIAQSSTDEYEITLQTTGGVELAMFSLSTDPTISAIAKRMILEKSVSRCVGKGIGTPKKICIVWNCFADPILNGGTHKSNKKDSNFAVVMSSDNVGSLCQAFAFPKYSPIQNTFNQFVDMAHAAGMMLKWNSIGDKQVFQERFKSKDNLAGLQYTPKGVVDKLKIENIKGPFVVYSIGFIAANIALILEMLHRLHVAKL